jgi:Zn-finger domain-containing protein
MDESLLIINAESYLKEIEEEKIDLNKISIFSIFKSTYLSFNNRLNKLHELKIDMEVKGYTAPNRSFVKYGIDTHNDPGHDELFENSKQIQFFRMKASSKKNIYDRVKSAIDAHKIAIGHLEEFAFIKCDDCNKIYKASDFFKLNKQICSCKSEKFFIELTKNGVSRIEIINYLPLSGNYMVLVSTLSNWGRESFKKVLKYLNQEKNSVVKTVSMQIKLKKNGRWIRKKINLDSQYSDSYEEKIRQDYGKTVRIEFLQFHKLKPRIINEKHTRNALALAYVGYCQKLIEENKQDILNKYIKNLKNLREYDEIIEDVISNKPEFFDEFDSLEDWKESEIEKNLKIKGLMDKKGNMDSVLSVDIKNRDKLEKNIFTHIAATLILWDIFKFYITKSKDARRRYKSPFPYLREDIDRKQREIFTFINNESINILKKYNHENIAQINNMDFILHKKFKLEEHIKGVRMNQVAFGGAIINLYTDLDISIISKLFSINEKSIKKEIKNIESIETPKTQRSKDFLKLIKN